MIRRQAGIPGTVKMLVPPPQAGPPLAGFDGSVWQMGECGILLAHEPAGPGGELLWHLSISCKRRYPTWDEIKAAWYLLVPEGRIGAILLPLPEDYVNVERQDNVFHVWETGDPRAVAAAAGR